MHGATIRLSASVPGRARCLKTLTLIPTRRLPSAQPVEKPPFHLRRLLRNHDTLAMHLFSFVESLHCQERAKEFHLAEEHTAVQTCGMEQALGSPEREFWSLRVHVRVP